MDSQIEGANLSYEEWVTIEEYPNHMVSNHGNLKGLKSGKILKLFRDPLNGYYHTTISNKANRKVIRIHRLVGLYFVPNPNNYPQLNHIDGDKSHNYSTNLEWCTGSYNLKHAYRLGLISQAWKRKPVIQLDINGSELQKHDSIYAAHLSSDVNMGNISRACRGIYQQAGGFKWEFELTNP